MLAVIDNWVVFDDFWRTETLLDFAHNIFSCVFHEDGRVRIALTHLGLTFLQSEEHVMRNNDRLILAFDAVAVFLCKHVHFSLIEAELADISFEEENVCALHTRVHDL